MIIGNAWINDWAGVPECKHSCAIMHTCGMHSCTQLNCFLFSPLGQTGKIYETKQIQMLSKENAWMSKWINKNINMGMLKCEYGMNRRKYEQIWTSVLLNHSLAGWPSIDWVNKSFVASLQPTLYRFLPHVFSDSYCLSSVLIRIPFYMSLLPLSTTYSPPNITDCHYQPIRSRWFHHS